MNTAVIITKEELKSALAEISREMQKNFFEQYFANSAFPREVMTVAQLCEYLQVSQQSIFNWIKRAKENNPLPVKYVGDDPRFYLDEIKDWIYLESVRKSLKKSK